MWYRFVFLAGLLVATMITIGVNLSPYATGYAAFVGQQMYIPWLMVALEWIIHYSTGISIFPFGSRDEDTYLLQKFLGYDRAVLVALIGGTCLAAFFSWTIINYEIFSTQPFTWMPVSNMLAPTTGFQTIPNLAVDFFNGADPFWRAFIDGFVPTFFENPLLIYSTVFLIWICPRYILKFLGVPDVAANLFGMMIWLIFSGVIFSYAYHSFVYQGVEAAYYRAYLFVLMNGVLVGLTGIPFPMDASHFFNNFFGSYFGIVSWGIVLAVMPLLMRSETVKKITKGLEDKTGALKPSWFPERGFLCRAGNRNLG